MNEGLVETATACLSEYAAVVTGASEAEQNAAQEDAEMHEGENANIIRTGGPSDQSLEDTYSEQTISHLLSLLSMGCKFSSELIASILSNGILQVLAKLLPKED